MSCPPHRRHISESVFSFILFTKIANFQSLKDKRSQDACACLFSPHDANLYVPAGSIEAYSTSPEWENFDNIAESANVTVSIQVDKASFEILTAESAMSYVVNVYADKDMTQLVAGTNYDANGKIIPMSTTLELSLDGFANGKYYYVIIVKSSTGEVLNNYKGTFEIDSAGISNITTDKAT